MTEIYAAGAVAAFTIDLLVYPLDTIKTRYQSQDYIKVDASSPLKKPFAPRGLYQGVGSVILATVPAAGLFFSTYENTKALFSRTLPLPDPLIHSSASAVAEMTSCLVLAPAEVIKQNAQMLSSRAQDASRGNSRRSTSVEAFRLLVRSPDGQSSAARRLFTGYTALIARNLPFTALQFPAFEHLRARLWERRRREKDAATRDEKGLLETGLISGVSAGSAGALAAYITTPSDVVKTRMMLSAGDSNNTNSSKDPAKPGEVNRTETERSAQDKIKKKKSKGAWAVTKRVYAERGVRGFFRGGLFRSAWTALGSGLYLGTYDTAKLWLTRDKPELRDVSL